MGGFGGNFSITLDDLEAFEMFLLQLKFNYVMQ